MKRRLLAALLMLAAPIAVLAAASPDPLAEIDACIARLDPQVDIGYARIVARCPDLTPALEQSGWAAWLPRGWKEARNDLSAGSLSELRVTVQRELAPRAPSRMLEVQRLKVVLDELGATGQQHSGVWARFKQWLRSLFQRRDDETDTGGFDRLLDRLGISDTILETITYVLLGGVVALAGLILFNELRAAGAFGGRRTRGAGGDDEELSIDRPRPTLRDIEQAALAERPRLLLELIAGKLTDLKLLPPAGAFTAREIVRTAQLREERDRSRLSELALTAERARYAAGSLEPAVVETAVEQGRALLTTLDTPGDVVRAGAAT
jgi:hypothetical protein